MKLRGIYLSLICVPPEYGHSEANRETLLQNQCEDALSQDNMHQEFQLSFYEANSCSFLTAQIVVLGKHFRKELPPLQYFKCLALHPSKWCQPIFSGTAKCQVFQLDINENQEAKCDWQVAFGAHKAQNVYM